MENDAPAEEAVAERERRGPSPQMAQKIVGWIVSAILIYFAQRDLRTRPAELVRGRVIVWRLAAMTPLGAVVYLLFGRRKQAADGSLATTEALAA